MAARSRRRQLFVINRRWGVGVSIALLAVAVGIVGILLARADQIPRIWAYAFLVIALIGSVGGMLMTIARNVAGDQIDE